MSIDTILRAIDAEHRDICRGAAAILNERMKGPRATLAAAKAVMAQAERAFRLEEQKHSAEHRDNIGEAQRWRTDARMAATGNRPVMVMDLPKVIVRPARGDGAKVTLARSAFQDRTGASA